MDNYRYLLEEDYGSSSPIVNDVSLCAHELTDTIGNDKNSIHNLESILEVIADDNNSRVQDLVASSNNDIIQVATQLLTNDTLYTPISVGCYDLLTTDTSILSPPVLDTIDEEDIISEMKNFKEESVSSQTPYKNDNDIATTIKRDSPKKKRKYDEDVFKDPNEERKRVNAVNAKKNRDKQIHKIDNITNENEYLKKEIVELKKNYDLLKKDNIILRLHREFVKDKCSCQQVAEFFARHDDDC